MERRQVILPSGLVWDTERKAYYVKPFTRADGVKVSGYWRQGEPAQDQSQDLGPVYQPPEEPVVSTTPVSNESPEVVVEDRSDYNDPVVAPASEITPSFEPEFIPEPEVYNDNTFDRLTGDGSIPEPDEIRQKPAEYRTDYEDWKLETENGGPAYKTWDKEKLKEFKSIGDTNNSTFMEMNELPSTEWIRGNLSKKDMILRSTGQPRHERIGRLLDIPEGSIVGARIDIPTYTSTGNFVVTLHDDDKPIVGSVLSYEPFVRLVGGVVFESNEKKAKVIGLDGKSKTTIAVTKGELSHDRSIPADIDKWVPVGYNPKKAVFFYDKRTGEEVIAGDESISYGNTVYVKGAVYPEPEKTRFATDRDEAFTVTKGYKRGKYMADVALAKSMSSDDLVDELYELAYFDPSTYMDLFGEMKPEAVVKLGYESLFSKILDS